MNTMYKEVVETRKAPKIVGVLLVVALMIVIANGIEEIRFFQYRLGNFTNPLLKIVACAIMINEFLKCRIKYRYSIIANQLIVHKLKDSEQYVYQNVKLKDIVFVGKMKDLTKKYSIVTSKNYACYTNLFNRYCCIYRDGDIYRKFYFQPSSKLLIKLNNIQKKSLVS